MSNSRRDKRKARNKRGPEAKEKRLDRTGIPRKVKCNLCSTPTRPEKLVGGNCPRCVERALGAA